MVEWLKATEQARYELQKIFEGKIPYVKKPIFDAIGVSVALYQWSHKNKGRDDIFIKHIEGHLNKGEEVICKICGKSAKQIIADELVKKEWEEPKLGCATTRQLLAEIRARLEVDGKLDYRTIDS